MRTVLRACLALLCILASSHAPGAHAQTAAEQKAVLVTGASTGIGRAIVERLAAEGHFVYAGARKPEDLEALGKIPNVQALRLDVTKPAEIAAAVETVTKGGRGLYGLVNNAGVAVAGMIVDAKEEDIDFVMDVNVYGPYRMTRAFAPLIVASKGRITTVSSIVGIFTTRDLPAYAMSKHAVEAFGDALAMQMEPQGVAVSLIEPGNYNSQLGASAAKRTGAPPRFAERSQYKEPVEVAAAVEAALFEAKPKRRYMVVPNQNEADITIRRGLQRILQLNEDQAYTYDREALIRILDEELAKTRPKRTP